MPAKKNPYWETRLKSLKANNSTWGAGRITAALEQEAAGKMREDAPGERWVGSHLKKLKGDPNWPQEEREYRTFRWPESMERGDMPWEASATALELLRYLDQQGGERRERPSVRFVGWFWRVSQAAPGCKSEIWELAAQVLTSYELSGKHVPVRGLEWWLAYRPWDGETQRRSYEEALSRTVGHIPEFDASVTSLASDLENNPELRAWMEGLFGKPLTADKSIFLWTMIREGVDTKTIRIEGEEANG